MEGSIQVLGLLKFRSLISPYAQFSISQKYLFEFLNNIHIRQVSSQMRRGGTSIM